MNRYTYTTQKQVRAAFWDMADSMNGDGITRRRIGQGDSRDYTADTRVAFCDFVDSLVRSGAISEALARRVTL